MSSSLIASGGARGNFGRASIAVPRRETFRQSRTRSDQGRTVVLSTRSDQSDARQSGYPQGAAVATGRSVTGGRLRAATSGRTNCPAVLQEIDEHVVAESLRRGEKGPSPVQLGHLLDESLQ
jgi:hypothetical protein